MGITTVSSREFNQDVSKAKRAAVNGPVFIPDPRSDRDALIAATALIHGMTVII
jgi:predicted nucleic acid-binding protein